MGQSMECLEGNQYYGQKGAEGMKVNTSPRSDRIWLRTLGSWKRFRRCLFKKGLREKPRNKMSTTDFPAIDGEEASFNLDKISREYMKLPPPAPRKFSQICDAPQSEAADL